MFQEKLPQRKQAQVETYLDQTLEPHDEDLMLLLSYSEELAQVSDLDNLPQNFPKEVYNAIHRHKDAYIAFLRKEKKLLVDYAEENIHRYNTVYRPHIESLKQQIEENKDVYILGKGAQGKVYKLNIENQDIVVKFYEDLSTQNFQLKAFLRAQGIENITHLIAYSYPDNVVLMSHVNGENLSDITLETKPQYSKKQLIDLINTVVQMYKHGIAIDTNAANFLYSSEKGFGIIDYLPADSFNPLCDLMYHMGIVISFAGGHSCPYKEGSKEYDAWVNQFYEMSLKRLVEFIEIIEKDFPKIAEDFKKRRKEDQFYENEKKWFYAFCDLSKAPIDNFKVNQYLERLNIK